MDVRNKEVIDFQEQHIYIFNHASNLDPVLAATQVVGKYIAKAEILSYPFFGYALKHLYVPVWRGDKEDRDRSMDALRAALATGESIIIYPEGTRNNGPDLLRKFHRGAFRLSLETGIPIAAMTAVNSHEILPGNKWLFKPGRLIAYWDGPFYPEGRTPDDLDEYRAMIRDTMMQRMLDRYPDGVLLT